MFFEPFVANVSLAHHRSGFFPQLPAQVLPILTDSLQNFTGTPDKLRHQNHWKMISLRPANES